MERTMTLHRKSLPMGETAFFLGILLSAMGIALQTKANLGLSMVAAPAYLLSLKFENISFGLGEWLVQGGLFLLCCLWTRKMQIRNLWSFIVAIPYGWVLDRMIEFLSWVQPTLFLEQLFVFLVGSVSLAAGIALFFHSYLPCQVYEMFVKCIARYMGKPESRVKWVYDWSSLTVSIVLSLLFFGRLSGIGVGTLLCTVINAPLIHMFGAGLDRLFDFRPAAPGLVKYFQ